MADLLTQLKTAQGEVARLSGELSGLSTFRENFAKVPNGDLAALLSEHASQAETITRLTGEVSTLTTRATTAETEVGTLRAQLSQTGGEGNVQELAENRAAEIVAGTGVVPAAADNAPSATGDGKSVTTRSHDEHWAHYRTLSTADKTAYYRANQTVMDHAR